MATLRCNPADSLFSTWATIHDRSGEMPRTSTTGIVKTRSRPVPFLRIRYTKLLLSSKPRKISSPAESTASIYCTRARRSGSAPASNRSRPRGLHVPARGKDLRSPATFGIPVPVAFHIRMGNRPSPHHGFILSAALRWEIQGTRTPPSSCVQPPKNLSCQGEPGREGAVLFRNRLSLPVCRQLPRSLR